MKAITRLSAILAAPCRTKPIVSLGPELYTPIIADSRAHSASVPIAVHLDHATTAEALELAIGCAEKHGVKFDSIMVDASHADVSLFRSRSLASQRRRRNRPATVHSRLDLSRSCGRIPAPDKADIVKSTTLTLRARKRTSPSLNHSSTDAKLRVSRPKLSWADLKVARPVCERSRAKC